MGRRTQARRGSGGKTLHGRANAPAHDDLDVLGENVGIGGHIRGEPVQQVPENRQGEVVDIAEACIRDFEVGAMGAHSMVDGVFMVSGMWNYMTGIDLRNFVYVYNCVGDHSFYTGAALLISCTIPAFFIKKGAWLQHRAHTLALWMMFTMAVPTFVTSSQFAVQASHNPTALFVVSALALASNVAVAVFQVYTMVTRKRHPLRDELYVELPQYREVREANI